MPSARFPRRQRLGGQSTFRQVLRQGTTLRCDWLSLTALPNGLAHTRFGCMVRRQAAPAGVFRNRLKRWLREAFRRNQAKLPAGLDLVATVLTLPAKPSYRSVEQEVLTLSHRLVSLPRLSSKESGSTGSFP